MTEERFASPLRGRESQANYISMCHNDGWTDYTELAPDHPLSIEHREFVGQAREIHQAILKERLGLHLELEEWFKSTYDVTWISWHHFDEYPEPALWNHEEHRPLYGNCPMCAKTRKLAQRCCVGMEVIAIRVKDCMGTYYNPLFISKIFKAGVVISETPPSRPLDGRLELRKRWDEHRGGQDYLDIHIELPDDVPKKAWEILYEGTTYPPQRLDDNFEEIDVSRASEGRAAAKARSQRWIDRANTYLASLEQQEGSAHQSSSGQQECVGNIRDQSVAPRESH